jgi:hypothetical protein
MGMDTVELVMAFEAAFDLEIPNRVADRMRTLRDVVDHVAAVRPPVAARVCTTQRVFHRIRRALHPAGGPDRPAPDTPLEAFADRDAWPACWERVRSITGEPDWPERIPPKGRWSDGPVTLGELALFVAAARRLAPRRAGDGWSRDEIVQTVRQVLWDQQGIWRAGLDDAFVEDLRLD